MGLTTIARRIPVLGPLAARAYRRWVPYDTTPIATPFRGSAAYWEQRYRAGGNSSAHVRQRRFSPWVTAHAPDWALIEHVPNRYPYPRRLSDGVVLGVLHLRAIGTVVMI